MRHKRKCAFNPTIYRLSLKCFSIKLTNYSIEAIATPIPIVCSESTISQLKEDFKSSIIFKLLFEVIERNVLVHFNIVRLQYPGSRAVATVSLISPKIVIPVVMINPNQLSNVVGIYTIAIRE
jgi:hypothetical protein